MDIEKLYDALTVDTGIPSIVATAVEQFVFSPISFWCEYHAPAEQKDSIDLFLQHQFEVGQNHQTDVANESYPGAVQEIFLEEEEGFLRTLELMVSGEQYIKNMPLLCRPIGLEGRPDLLVRVDGVDSELGDYSYFVVEIKSSRNIRPPHILQGAAYNRLVGIIQSDEPQTFDVVNRDSEIATIKMSNVAGDLDQALDQMRQIMAGATVEPVYGTGRWPWETHVNRLAAAANDVSLIPGVGSTKRKLLIESGYKTVDSVAASQEDTLTALQGIGVATARKFITSAKAITTGQPIRRATTLAVPDASIEVFFDLEGTDSRISADGLEVVNYLIGALVRSSSQAATFVPFFASSFDEEKRILKEFFEWAAALEGAVFYHWHHYEKTNLQKMTDHYELPDSLATPVMDRLVDLSPIVTKSFAFPSYGEGLKDIARCLGFSWRHEDVSALTTIALYYRYVNSPGTEQETRQQILDYNEDDCRATMHIFDWLNSQQT